MEGAQRTVACPACGSVFAVPLDTVRLFCSKCGTQIPLPAPDVAQSAARVSGEKAQQAATLALDAVQQALDLAQAGGSEADKAAALEAARQAMDAARIAQESQKALADAQAAAAAAESARIAAQTQAQLAADAERARREAEAECARREAAEAERARKEAEERAAQEAAARARAEAEARAQVVQAQTQVVEDPKPVPLEYRRGAVVRSTANGYGLFTVTIPTTWTPDEAVLLRGNSGSRPFNAFASFSDGVDAGMTLTLGDAGVRNSAGMEAMMAQYGAAIAAADRTNYAPMPGARSVADDYTSNMVGEIGGTGLSCCSEMGGFNLAARQQEAQAVFKKAADATGPAILRDPFAAELVRIYTFNLEGAQYRLAVYVRIYAIKDGSGVDMMSPAGLLFGLGSAIGNHAEKKKEAKRAKKDPTFRTDADSVAASDGKPFCSSDFSDYTGEGTIFWDVSGIATLYAPADRFGKAYAEAFIPFVTGYWPHDDILNLALADAQQQAAAVQQATSMQVQRMNMQFQAQQAAMRQVQAAADARFEAWQRQSDAHHAAFRERTNAQFNDSGYGGGAGDWSEAIRGVNTFVTSDGREVQLDASADRAYENQAGDVIGGSGGFDPGADWNQIPRK